MPKILVVGRFVFLLFASDVAEARRHIHVEVKKGRRRHVAKFWLEPMLELVEAGDLNDREVREVVSLIRLHEALIASQLDRFYAGKPVKVKRL